MTQSRIADALGPKELPEVQVYGLLEPEQPP
jgi:hypothetical protein